MWQQAGSYLGLIPCEDRLAAATPRAHQQARQHTLAFLLIESAHAVVRSIRLAASFLHLAMRRGRSDRQGRDGPAGWRCDCIGVAQGMGYSKL